MTIEAYPLTWPANWKRTPPAERFNALFGRRSVSQGTFGSYSTKKRLSIADGVDRVLDELDKLGADDLDAVIVSTNAKTRNDGLPRSGAQEPDDPGAAVYFTLDGEPQCVAIDIYSRLADNLAAIAATLSALRQIERHGGAQILKRAFTGFKQLTEAAGTTMGVDMAWEFLAQYRGLATWVGLKDETAARSVIRFARAKAHPDADTGDNEKFHRVQLAAEVLGAHFGQKL